MTLIRKFADAFHVNQMEFQTGPKWVEGGTLNLDLEEGINGKGGSFFLTK